MLQYNFEIIPWPIWILIGIFCLCFTVQLIYYFYFYISVLLVVQKTKKGKISFSRKQPGISVIICAKNESKNLAEFLPYILNQQYPDFEVIVVNDGSTDESEEILTELKKDYPQLYHTYVPQDTKVMSPKKLAITVGIKAAKNDLLLFTDADCKPESEKWIANMVRNFSTGTDFVLGYGAYQQQKGFLSHLISYDTLFIALQYMGFSFRGKPYMGIGRNMAYRKKLFFDMKGFASILHLQSGDDDLFVNKAATKDNTKIEISPESITVSTIKESFKDWLIQKERHLSTANYYKSESKYLIGTEVMSRGLFYASFLGLLLYTDIALLLTALGVFIVRYISQLLIINLSAKHFKERYFYLSIIILDILLPLLSLFIFIRNIFSRRSKYQWK